MERRDVDREGRERSEGRPSGVPDAAGSSAEGRPSEVADARPGSVPDQHAAPTEAPEEQGEQVATEHAPGSDL